jgi:hypothetical protein
LRRANLLPSVTMRQAVATGAMKRSRMARRMPRQHRATPARPRQPRHPLGPQLQIISKTVKLFIMWHFEVLDLVAFYLGFRV